MQPSLRRLVLGLPLTALALLSAPGCSSSSSCSITPNADGSSTLHCTDGTSATIHDGTDGTSCTVHTATDGSRVIMCEDGTMVTLRDGMNGTDGTNGTDGMTGTNGRNALLTGPGFRVTVTSAGIDTTSHPFVEMRFTDAAGRPLDRTGTYTEGAIDASFTVAHLPTEVRTDGTAVLTYTSYLMQTVMSADGTRSGMQAVADHDGTWTEIGVANGTYRYTFAATLPSGYPATETHRIGMYGTRSFDGVRYVVNATNTFRPDGMAITVTRDIVTTAACSSCHQPISNHDGTREDLQLCVTCHSRGTSDPDTGESLDFEAMIHRVHRGEHLPSVAAGQPFHYVEGMVDHDFSTVAFPQDVRHCDHCHTGPDGAAAVSPHVDLAMTQPSRAACGSCHDDIWFEAGTPPAWMHLHPGGDRPDDSRCTTCHQATGGLAPIIDSHLANEDLPIAQQPGVAVDAVALTTTRNIQIDFTVTMNGAPRNILAAGQALTSLSLLVGGPTTDYLFNTSFTLTTASQGTLTAVDGPNGRFRWVSALTVDQIATNANADPLRSVPGVTITPTGTWALGLQATMRVNDVPTTTSCSAASTCATTAGHLREGSSWGCVSSFCTPQVLYAARNPVAYLALTDPTPVPRRTVVDVARCDVCHSQLQLHGGGRNDPEFCVICHNAPFDTIDRMPVPAGGTATTQSLSLAHFVHRIHTGEHGVSPATFWGPAPSPRPTPGTGGTPVDFSEVRYPTDRRVCEACHVESAAGISIADLTGHRDARTRVITDTRTTVTTTSTGIVASACTGCHDSSDVAAHTAAMTTATGSESCTTCHEPGEAFGLDVVHARPEYDLR